jgi:hypothetical protein
VLMVVNQSINQSSLPLPELPLPAKFSEHLVSPTRKSNGIAYFLADKCFIA